MKSTDIFYEIDRDAAMKEQIRILEALSYDSEKRDVTMEDIDVLGRILAWQKQSGETGMFENIVDYLWMSFRIGLNAKMLLLDLLYV